MADEGAPAGTCPGCGGALMWSVVRFEPSVGVTEQPGVGSVEIPRAETPCGMLLIRAGTKTPRPPVRRYRHPMSLTWDPAHDWSPHLLGYDGQAARF